MYRPGLCVGLLLLASSLGSAAQGDDSTAAIEGIWEGALQVGVSLRLVVHIERDGDELVARMDSPDQGATGIDIDRIRFADNTLKFSIKRIAAKYDAKLQGDTLVGQWRQGGARADLNLKRVTAPTAARRPQVPAPPFPYSEVPVRFTASDGSAQLAGTLTLPAVEPPFTAVVLVSGSGPQDRDATVFEHKPFLVIADHLARSGLAVLRFDDRGVGASTGERSNATMVDFARDATGAVTFLSARDDIGTVGIIGHSEGALVADLVAAKEAAVTWVVRLAGPAVTGQALLEAQTEAVFRVGGGSEDVLDNIRALNFPLYAMAASPITLEQFETDALRLVKEKMAAMTEQQRRALGLDDDPGPLIKGLATPWFRHFVRHDAGQALAKVTVPVLAVFGGKDTQVPEVQNAPIAEQALVHKASRVATYTELNHLFQNAETGAPAEYARLEQTFDTKVLDDITTWLATLRPN